MKQGWAAFTFSARSWRMPWVASYWQNAPTQARVLLLDFNALIELGNTMGTLPMQLQLYSYERAILPVLRNTLSWRTQRRLLAAVPGAGQ